MKRPYVVTIGDRAGVFAESRHASFADALEVVKRARAKYPAKCVDISNADFCDYDHDGLTDEEREALP